MKTPDRLLSLSLIFVFVLGQAAAADKDIQAAGTIGLTAPGSTYTQDFDSLASSGTSSVLPSGWYFIETGTNANDTYAAGTGSSTTGNTYSFGAAGSTERALGGLRTGTLIPIYGVSFTNNTGSVITSLEIMYIGEMWRLGAAGRTDRIDFQWSIDATSLSTGTWTDDDALDFSTPSSTGSVGSRNGNDPLYQTVVGATISGLDISNGTTFWIRWIDLDASGSDDGLAVDNFSLTPAGVSDLPSILPTKTGAIIGEDGDGKADPGETIEYTVMISNEGDGAASDVIFSDTIDAHTTLVDGSLHASPIAVADTYNARADTLLRVGGVAGSGDPEVYLPDGSATNNDRIIIDTTSIDTILNGTTEAGGTLNLNSDGTFTYFPSPGFIGEDTFTYTLRNDAASNLTDTATVLITVGAEGLSAPSPFNGTGGGRSLLHRARAALLQSGESINLPIGTLEPGKSVTITFRVTVDSLLSPDVTQISNQGMVSAAELGEILTDDPSGIGTADPTLIPVAGPETIVSAISRTGNSPTNADSVSWVVTFNDAVAGLTASNFMLVNGGLEGSPMIMEVTPTATPPASEWTVTANTGSGDGTLGLNLTSDTGLSHALTDLPFTGEEFTIDRTAPHVHSMILASTDPTYAASVEFTVTFSEEVTGVDEGDFLITTSGTLDNVSIAGVTGSDTSYTVVVDTGTGEGSIQLDVDDNDTIRNATNTPLGGFGEDNGNFSGPACTVRPPLAAGFYDDSHAAWNYTGSWQVYSGARPTYGTLHYTYGLGGGAQVFINGAQFRLTYSASSNYGIVDVFVDNVRLGSFSQNSTPSGWQKIWTSPPLTAGVHKVQFVKASSALQINLDAIEVLEVAAPVLQPGKYDDPDAAFAYSTGWFTLADMTRTYLGTLHYTYWIHNSAQVFIHGAQFELTYTASPNYGIMDIYVDDVKVGSFDQNGTPTGWQRTWTSPPMPAGIHKVRFAKASPGAQINIDAIEVLDVAAPVLQPGQYDDLDAAFRYSAGWFSASGIIRPYLGTLHYTYNIHNSAQLFINGSRFTLTYTASPNYGIVDVYVDDLKVASLDQNSAPSGWQRTWTSDPWPAGIHKVKLVKANTGMQINIDAIEVLP